MSEDRKEVVVRGDGEGLHHEVFVGSHRLAADEPLESGGSDRGPNPYDLLLASLGACTAMTLTMYAQRKGLPLRGVTTRLQHSRIYADDYQLVTAEGTALLDPGRLAVFDVLDLEVTPVGHGVNAAGRSNFNWYYGETENGTYLDPSPSLAPLLASVVGIPVGTMAGVYLSEYSANSKLAAPVRFVRAVSGRKTASKPPTPRRHRTISA